MKNINLTDEEIEALSMAIYFEINNAKNGFVSDDKEEKRGFKKYLSNLQSAQKKLQAK